MKVSVYLGEPVEEALDAVGEAALRSRSGRINTVVDRYLRIIQDAMPAFTKNEWFAIFDAHNGVVMSNWLSALHACNNVADSPWLDARWGIDHANLARRMEALPTAGRIAVAEAIERFWGAAYEMETDALKKIGVRLRNP
ncbi:MAG: hypothetical protein J2P48_16660 [Alphaproteobacteria bacterium]|nr:hypothetical protein [Alphaproteobacteria bacterium]